MQITDLLAQMDGLQSMARELGDLMGSPLGGGGAATGAAMPRNAAPGLGSVLDLSGDGNPLDDILRMAGKAMR